MNGRIYDGQMARMLSADPTIPEPGNLQAYSRYAYVFNDPINRWDPSGYKPKWGRLLLSIALAVATQGMMASEMMASIAMEAGATAGANAFAWTSFTASGLTTTGAAVSAAVGGFVGGLVASGGDFKSAAAGALTGGIGGVVGATYGSSFSAEAVTARAVAGGAAARISGGDFRRGFGLSLGLQGLAYVNSVVRAEMVEQSRKFDPIETSDGKQIGNLTRADSPGFLGDRNGLAGSRFSFERGCVILTCKPLSGGRWATDYSFQEAMDALKRGGLWGPTGGLQGGPIALFGRVLGTGPLDSTIHRFMEAWAGPHDWLNNRVGTYDSIGNLASSSNALVSSFRFAADVVNLGVAAPVALGGLTYDQAWVPAAVQSRKRQ
jgi:hypothetical protein